MKTTLKLLAVIYVAVSFAAHAQVMPEATGPGAPNAAIGKLQYAVRYSETGEFTSTLSNFQTSTASGSASYANGNDRLPFTLDYAGGYTWTLTGPNYESGQFHHLFLSQGIDSHKSKILLSDDVSYLPESPTTGFSGIPGIGEPIGVTNPAPVNSTQSILALNTHAIDNIATGRLEQSLTSATSFLVSGSSGLLRFPDNDGYDTDSLMGTAQVNRRLNGRNTLYGNYQFAEFTYLGYSQSFNTSTALAGIRREWTRNLTTDFSGGPQWISSSDSTAVPSSVNVSANASINYLLRFTSASLTYSRGTNGGSGYLIGGQYDTLTGGLSRAFGPNLTLGLAGGYERTAALNSNGVTDGSFGGVQATWRLGRNMILFANYTATDQTTSSALPTNALNELLQEVGFGVGFSPRVSHRNQ